MPILPAVASAVSRYVAACPYPIAKETPLFLGARGGPLQPGVVRASGSPPTRFGTEGVAFNSTPLSDPDDYPSAARCAAIFEGACARLAAAVRAASDERLDAPEPWGKAQLPMADLIVRVNLHNAMHTGQLVDLRRALELPRVIV